MLEGLTVSGVWGNASALTKMLVVSEIENMAAQYGLSQLDIANLLALVRVESTSVRLN